MLTYKKHFEDYFKDIYMQATKQINKFIVLILKKEIEHLTIPSIVIRKKNVSLQVLIF